MAHRFVNQIGPGEAVEGIYLIKEPVLRSTVKGDPYIAMFICDRTGQINGRMWQASQEVYLSLPKPGFVAIQGRSELYQNSLQIVVNSIKPVDPSQIRMEDYLASTTKDIKAMFSQVQQILSRIKHPQIRALVDHFLADTQLMESFCKSPAAVKIHHDYLGGLLEHTHNMLQVAEAILPFYPELQHDLVIAGIFLHDMGKTEELSCQSAFSYTDSGQLIGHIVKTVLMIHAKADQARCAGLQIDQEVLDMLDHIVLAHHGAYEFGSPKLPATAEAFMVSYIDQLDARISQVNAATSGDFDGNWTAWQNSLQTRLYRRRIQ
ncbi:MAG: HD domain-containing protein [Sedimentisphaerales bacterium]|jgi:3'-5' exoribonuclease|nr:HD domain-containing protein [Sedimentisphaerales bacterium]